MHDAGSWMDQIAASGRQGWVLITETVRENVTGQNYTVHSSRGFGVMVRLNWGYGADGTIPTPAQYPAMAAHCKSWVSLSQGAKFWIIGNEMNQAAERPGGPADANKITPAMYADCFRRCRDAIRSLPGHADDLVLTGAVAPYNNRTVYDGNLGGDWVQYLQDLLNLVKGGCDGITLHAYTHGADPGLVFSEAKMNPPFASRNYHFRVYREFMNVIPAELKGLPVFVTEAQPTPDGCDNGGWIPNQTHGWIGNAFKEINDWNIVAGNQSIQALVLFRWSDACNAWRIEDKDWLRNDFFQTAGSNYRVKPPTGVIPKTYRVAFLADSTPASIAPDAEVQVSVTLRNDGNFAWRAVGPESFVRFGFRWFDANGQEVPARDGARTPLPRDIQVGESVTLSSARVIAPPVSATLTLRLDLVEEGVTWFSDAGSPPHNKIVSVSTGGTVSDYAFSVINSSVPVSYPRGASTDAALTLRNDGRKTWPVAGPYPVTLGFHWFRPGSSQETLVTRLVRVPMPHDVPTGGTVAITIGVLAPFAPGAYNLMFDLVEEGVTEFRNAGAQPFIRSVTVVGPQYFASWLAASTPATMNVDQVRGVKVTVRNDGSKTWVAAGTNRVRLVYVWFDRRDARILLKQDIRATLPRDVSPGDSVDVPIDVLSPDRPGSFSLRFDLVEEGITSFVDQGSPVLERNLTVQAGQDYQVSFGDVITLVSPAAQFTFNLKIRNDGGHIWAAGGANPVRIGYAWFDGGNQPVLVAQDIRTALPSDMAPGDEAVVTASTVAPDHPGRYRLRWSLVEEGIAWFYDRGARSLDVSVDVVRLGAPVPQPPDGQPQADVPYRATFTPVDSVSMMEPDAQRAYNVKVRNDGTKLWPKAGGNPVHVGYRWYRGAVQTPLSSDIRTELPTDIGTGQEGAFGAQVVAPSLPDIYTLRIDLVEEGITWFGDSGTSRPLEYAVQVRKAAPIVSVQASHNNSIAPHMVNADPTAVWTSGQRMEPGMWVQADLGLARVIDAIAVRSGGRGAPAGYDVLVSSDGSRWTALGTRERNAGDIMLTFAPCAMRYIKVMQTGMPPWNTPWQVAEIAVHPAPSWQAAASVNTDLAGLAVDNNPETVWTTGVPQQPGMSFTLDMGLVQTVAGVALPSGPQADFPQDFAIQVSTDGQTWQIVARSPAGGNFLPLDVLFDPLPARYIHVECTGENRRRAWTISEVKVQRTVTAWEILRG
jgi:F5/8 type C domain/Ig-like domain from next to BRCA1 gene